MILLPLRVLRVALVRVPFFVGRGPPWEVETSAVRPTQGQDNVAKWVRAPKGGLVGSRGETSDRCFKVRVTCPCRAVSLGTVPRVFLRVRVGNVNSNRPCFVRPIVVAAREAAVEGIPRRECYVSLFRWRFHVNVWWIGTYGARAAVCDLYDPGP